MSKRRTKSRRNSLSSGNEKSLIKERTEYNNEGELSVDLERSLREKMLALCHSRSMVLGNKTTIFYVKKLLNKEQSEGRLTIKQRKGQPLEDLWNGVFDEYWKARKIWSKRSKALPSQPPEVFKGIGWILIPFLLFLYFQTFFSFLLFLLCLIGSCNAVMYRSMRVGLVITIMIVVLIFARTLIFFADVNICIEKTGRGDCKGGIAAGIETSLHDFFFPLSKFDLAIRKHKNLHSAIKSRDRESTLALLEGGMDPNDVSSSGSNALHIAATYGCYSGVLDSLIQATNDLNTQDKNGQTALYKAALMEARMDTFIWLKLRPSYFVNGWTYESGCSIVQSLIRAGADLNTKDKEGRTALYGMNEVYGSIIKKAAKPRCIKIMEDAGAYEESSAFKKKPNEYTVYRNGERLFTQDLDTGRQY